MNLKQAIVRIENFPAQGIIFRDLNPLWENPELFKIMIDKLKEQLLPLNPTRLVALEARGFIIGSALSYAMGVGISLIRKKGKLPGKLYTSAYRNEYTFTGDVEIQASTIKKGDRIVLVDDILATGKSTLTCLEIFKNFEDIKVLAAAYVLELTELNAKTMLEDFVPVISLIKD